MPLDGDRGRRKTTTSPRVTAAAPRPPMDGNRRPPIGPRAAGPSKTAMVTASTAAAAAAAVSSPAAARYRPGYGPPLPKPPPIGDSYKNSAKWCSSAERCPLCSRFRKSFHCKTCVAAGNFSHSSAAITGDRPKFSKKQAKYQTLLYSSNLFKNDCTKMFARKQHTTSQKTETLILQDKIQNIKFAIMDKHRTLNEKKNQLEKLKLEIDEQKSKVDRYEKRVIRLEEFTRSQEALLGDKTTHLHTIRPDLKNIIQTRVNQLVTHIFSLDEVHPVVYPDEELDEASNLSRALSEASKLTYVCGQWVNTCEEWSRQTEFGYRIVAPTLPANGNYSAYNEWVSDKSKDFAFNQTFSEPNPACKISAGLTYTSQLVKQLSFFLNVFLPRRQHFSEFCGNELNPNKFAKYVTHLNANVLYLCFSQNVDPKFLNPDHTLKNILLLLDTTYSDLGRFGPPDIDSELCEAFEEKIALQLVSCTGDSDSEEENYHEWEDVPSTEFSQEQSQFPLDTTSSVVRAGLVASTAASIASIWRGWTK